MTRQIRPVLRIAQAPQRPSPGRRNQGWGKLVGATVLGVAGALTLQLPGAITGMVIGAALGHWFDLSSADSDAPTSSPRSADELASEANALLAVEVAEAFSALDRTAGRSGDKTALAAYLRKQLSVESVPRQGPEIPWQQDLASACGRLAQRLDGHQKAALVVALYRHAQALELGPGPARLMLRDGVAALGLGAAEEEELRAQAGML